MKKIPATIIYSVLIIVQLFQFSTAETSSSQNGYETLVTNAKLAMDREDYATALDAIQSALENGDKRFGTALLQAKVLSITGKIEESIGVINRLLDRGYNPVKEITNSSYFQNIKNSDEFESLRLRLEPCLSGAYETFAFKTGEWEISNKANEGNAKDQSQIVGVADGCALYEKYWTTYGYEAENFKAYDKVKKKWTMLIVDNQGFYLNFIQNDDSENVVLEAFDDVAMYRASWESVSDDSFKTLWMWSRDNGVTWQSYVKSVYHRKVN